VFSAVKLQAYTFTIKNLTDKAHYVAIQLKGSQKPSESKMVEMYGAKSGLFAQATSKASFYTAVFEFGGIRCVSKILVDGNALPIYGVPGKKYDELQAIFDRGPGIHRMEFLGKINDGINGGKYTDMTKTLIGICFSRQFDIIDLDGNGKLVAITREKI
jgi:hypothetical protein